MQRNHELGRSTAVTQPKLTFLGAAETVSGSRYLLETGKARILVDCGLFQGLKKLRERNWSELPFEAASLDAVVLTHAHIDHTGYLPKLCQLGFRGHVYCTPGTRDLLGLLLPDSAFLQEEEAKYANKLGYSKHTPAKPLYTRADAERALGRLTTVPFHERFDPVPGISASFSRAGHIIGAASITLGFGGRRLTFTGDVGRLADPIMKPPAPLEATDFLVIESTYGDRKHPAESVNDALARIVTETAARGGVILVPAFAVGRAQHLLHVVASLVREGRIPSLPVFLDSPMAIDATELFRQHADDHRLQADACRLMCEAARYARTPEDSKAIDAASGPMIVISASGMATGGRVLHHLRRFLPEEKNCVVFVGYQATGTRGRALLEGADELKIHGQYVRVQARIEKLQGLSAHADYSEMLDWLRSGRPSPERVFVTHGEPAAADTFRRRLGEAFGWNASVPEMGEAALLD
ncbi:MAG TPA: MBL fold metallo-hydrolase [Polyangiaceae bacterium]